MATAGTGLRGYWPMLLLTAAAIGVPLGMLAIASLSTFRDIERAQIEAATHTAEALSEHAQRTLRAQELIVDMVLQLTEGRSWEQLRAGQPQLTASLARLVSSESDLNAVVVSSADGMEAVSNNGAFRNRGIARRDFFRQLSEDASLKCVFSAPSVGQVTGQRNFSLAKRRTDAAGRFQGVVYVAVRTDYFENMYAGLVRDPADAIGLVRSDGVLIARGPAIDKPMTLPPDSGLMTAIREHPERGQFESRAVLDNVERIYAYQRLGEYPLYISVARAKSAVWAEWRARMIPYLVLCVVAIGLLLVTAWLARRHYLSEMAALRRLAEEAALRAHAEAQRAALERDSRSKDEFLAGLSHELRNPVGSIALAAETLNRTMPRDGGIAEQALRILANQTRQLRRLLEDMLDLAGAIHGKISLKPMPIEMRAFLGELLAEWASAEGGVRPAVSGGPAWVNADPMRLRQVFFNLLDNAQKYGGHHVDIAIVSRQADGRAWVETSVTDDGEGMAPELVGTLFQPFVRGPNAGGRSGLGLGLALIRRLAELQGGTLSGASDGPGRGARFVLRLPAAEAGAESVQAASAAAAEGQLRVLVVDDQADARDSLRLVLQMDGHVVSVADSGERALQIMGESPQDVVFCDIGMPGMDGYQFAERARQFDDGKAAILVALSGYGTEADRHRSREAGFDFHLVKPAPMQEIRKVLEAAAAGATTPA